MPIPNRYYERSAAGRRSSRSHGIADSNRFQPITDKVRQVDYHGGFTAAAGHALYTARAYPQEYWNRTAFVTEPTGHLVGTFVLTADGADFRSTSPWNLLASDDEWTAPIMAEVGPDGNVWVIDWYNYIVQHNPTPAGFKTGKGTAYETDLRDKTHGRIYRIVYDTATPARSDSICPTPRPPSWSRRSRTTICSGGGTPSGCSSSAASTTWCRSCVELVDDKSVDAIGLNVGAIHALWTLHGLGRFDGDHPKLLAAVAAALRHPSAGVRRNAVQVLPLATTRPPPSSPPACSSDADPQVRLQSLLALADQPPSDEAGRAVAAFIANPRMPRTAGCSTPPPAPPPPTPPISSSRRGEAPPLPEPQCSRQRRRQPLRPLHVAGHGQRAPRRAGRRRPGFAGAVIEGLQAGWPQARPNCSSSNRPAAPLPSSARD